MAQERITAKNTFGEGLVMDFAPDNVQANVLTNALNATLLTFNGNEMSLQNDMGNARVESAYLPEGYIPVGTCEFGDIIYIVSYNPLTHKSQIGCFPSPERNIESSEVSPLDTIIGKNELTELSDDNLPTIHKSSIKKIIFGGKNLNAGDKFIISWGNTGFYNYDKISNYGNTENTFKDPALYWPKIVKINVVAIEDSGKITYLSDSVKWYKTTDTGKKRDFIISQESVSMEEKDANLDTYRHALQCQYSVFQARTSGKLALLLELETIDGFNCGHKAIKRVGNLNGKLYKYYDIYLSTSWETSNYNINPCGFLVSQATYSGRVKPITVDNGNITILASDATTNHKLHFKSSGKYKTNSRMVPYNRLYEMENPQDSFQKFLEKSYYEHENSYNSMSSNETAKFRFDRQGYSTSVLNVIRAYTLVTNVDSSVSQVPGISSEIDLDLNKYLDLYVANANAVKYTEDNKLLYKSITREGVVFDLIPTPIPDDIIVNKFKKPVLKYVGSVIVDPTAKIDRAKLKEQNVDTLEYTVCPCMPYGPLEQYEITNVINFQEDSGKPELTLWRYYVNAFSTTLNFGFNTHLGIDSDQAVGKVIMEFYDNQGLCATYRLADQDTFDSTFTEYIAFDKRSNSKLSAYDWLNSNSEGEPSLIIRPDTSQKLIYEDIKGTGQEYNYLIWNNGKGIFEEYNSDNANNYDLKAQVAYNTAGILFYGRPYLVKIYVYKGELIQGLNTIEYAPGYIPEPIVRWLWTAPVFNNYYRDTLDFDSCRIECALDVSASMDGRALQDALKSKQYVNMSALDPADFKAFRSLGAQVEYINLENENAKILVKGEPILSESFGNSIAFNTGLVVGQSDATEVNLEDIEVRIGLNNPIIEVTEGTTIHENSSRLAELPILKQLTDTNFETTVANYGKELTASISGLADQVNNEDIYSSENAYEKFKDTFSLELNNPGSKERSFEYLNTKGEQLKCKVKTQELKALDWKKNGIALNLKGIKFNKIIAESAISQRNKVLKPLLHRENDFTRYGLACKYLSNTQSFVYFNKVIYIGLSEKIGDKLDLRTAILDYTDNPDNPIMTHISYDEEWKNGVGANSIACTFTDIGSKVNAYLTQQPFWQIIFGRANGSDNDKGIRLNYAVDHITSLLGVETFMNDDSPQLFTSPSTAWVKQDSKISIPIDHRIGQGFSDVASGTPVLNQRPAFKVDSGHPMITDMFTCLGLNVGGTLWPTGDIGALSFAGTPTTGKTVAGKVTQRFHYQTKRTAADACNKTEIVAKNDEVSHIESYAQMLASLLCQLYYVTSDTETSKNITSYALLKDSTEIWKKDIIINLLVNNAKAESLNDNPSSRFLRILYNTPLANGDQIGYGYSLDDYARVVLTRAYNTPGGTSVYTDDIVTNNKISLNNINPLFKESVKCVEFQYEMPYNIENIKELYLETTTTVGTIYVGMVPELQKEEDPLETEKTNLLNSSEYKRKLSASIPVNEGELYTYNFETNNISRYTDSSTIYYIRNFIKQPDSSIIGATYDWDLSSRKPLKLNTNSGLSTSVSVDTNGQLTIPNDSQMYPDSTYNISHLTWRADWFTIGGFHTNHIFNTFSLIK